MLRSVMLIWSIISFPATARSLSIKVEKWAEGLSPDSVRTVEGLFVDYQVYETLLVRGPGGAVLPGLVGKWRGGPEARKVYLTIADNVRFSDGSPVNSMDVVRLLERSIAADIYKGLTRIRGAVAYAKKQTDRVGGIEIRSSREVVIHLVKPYPRLLADLASFRFRVSRPSNSGIPIGTGPFRISKVEPKRHSIELERNPFYRAKNAVKFDKVFIETNPSSPPDISFVEPPSDLHDRYLSVPIFDPAAYFIAFNSDHPKLSNVKVRRSLMSFVTPALVGRSLPGTPKGTSVLPLDSADMGLLRGKSFSVTFSHPKFQKFAAAYCDSLNAAGVGCCVRRVGIEEYYKLRRENQIEISLVLALINTLDVDMLLSPFSYVPDFLPIRPSNPYFPGMESLVEQLIDVPPDRAEIIQTIHSHIDRMFVDSAMARPLSSSIEGTVWIRRGLRLPPLSPYGPHHFDVKDVVLEY